MVVMVAGCALATEPTRLDPDAVAMPTPLDCPEPAALRGEFATDMVLAESSGGTDPNVGPGTGTVCLDLAGGAPSSREVICTWSADRHRLLAVQMFEAQIADRTVEVILDLPEGQPPRIQLWPGEPGPNVAFVASPGQVEIDATGTGADGRADATTARELPIADDGSPPIQGLPRSKQIRVALRWRCGAPPPPVPGVSTGRMLLNLDAPIGRTFTLSGTCVWIIAGDQPMRVTRTIVNARHAIGPDTFLQASVNTASWGNPTNDGLEMSLSLSDATFARSSHFGFASGATYWLDRAENGAFGHVRFRGLADVESDGPHVWEGGIGEVDLLSGTIRWTCAAPVVAPPAGPAEPVDPNGPEVVAGRLVLEFDDTLAGLAFEGAATCVLERSDDGEVYAPWISARLPDGDGSLVVDASYSRLRIARIDAAAAFVGEYEGDVREYGSVKSGPFSTFVPGLDFLGTDLAFRPFEGGEGPVRSTGVRIRYGCDVPAEAPA